MKPGIGFFQHSNRWASKNKASFQKNLTGYQGQAFFIRTEEKNIDLYRYLINGLSFGGVLSTRLDKKPINKLCGFFGGAFLWSLFLIGSVFAR